MWVWVHHGRNDNIREVILWRVLRDAEQAVRQAANRPHLEIAVVVERAVREIVAQSAQELALGHAIQLAQRYVITGVQMNARDASVPVQMIVKQDAKQTVYLPAQRIVRTPVPIALVVAEAVVMRFVQMIVLADAREDAIQLVLITV